MGDRGSMDGLTISRVDSTYVKQRGMGSYQRRPGTKPITAPYELTETHKDDRDVEKQARLYEESVGYPNLANQAELVQRAKYAVLAGLKDVFNVMEFLRNKWLILYRLYRGETLNEWTYGRLQLHSPEPFKIIETLHPRLMRTIYGSEKWFSLYAESDQHDPNAKAQEAMCRDQFRNMQHYEKASRLIRNGLIYGTAIQKTYWKQQIGTRKYRSAKRKPHPKIPGATIVDLSEIKKEELAFDGNYSHQVEIFDFLTSPNASSIEEAEWAADRSLWPDYKVKQMGELGHWLNLDQLERHPGSKDLSFGDDFKERKSYSYGVFDPREASNAPHIPHYQVIDWYGPLVVKEEGGGYETKMCNVVMIEPDGPQIIARITEIPWWHGEKPYQVWKPIDLENEMYGIGAIEMIARLSREKDVKRQLGMAAAQLAGNPAFALSDEANIPGGQLVLQPGLAIRTGMSDPSKAIWPIHIPDTSDTSLKAEAILTTDIRETAGTTSPSMGASDPFGASDKTATQHTSEVDMTNLRVSDMVSNYEKQVIESMLRQMTWNNQQFMSYDRVIRDVGAIGIRWMDRYTIRPEDLIGRFIVQSLASFRLLTKQTQVQQLVNLLDRIPVFAQIYGPTAIKGPKLMAYVLEHGFDIRNADEFVSVPPEEGGLLTAIQEHELWYHGEVPPRRSDDNDLRHALNHLAELRSERFKLLTEHDPGTADLARAHAAQHMIAIALKQEQQEKIMMEMSQAATAMGIQAPPLNGRTLGEEGGMNVPGAAGPGQEPGSPKIRPNEIERGEGQGKSEMSEATRRGPNPGAS